MRALWVLLLVGCIDIPTGLNEHIDLLTEAAEVASVTCSPVSLAIATNEIGTCSAFNVDGTRIDMDGFAPVVWKSSDPSAVSISTAGEIRAESVVSASVTITALGTNGVSASTVVGSV